MKWMVPGALVAIALFAVGACQNESGNGGPGGSGLQCPAGAVSCTSGCTNLQSDPNNCGSCGNSCGALFCSSGQCASECAAGLTPCGQACEDLQTSFQSCGSCGTECASGVCSNGVCGGVDGAGGGNGSGGGTGSGGTGGGGGGGGGLNSGDPLGFWRYDDLHGCAWTGVDQTGSGSVISPNDFTLRALDQAYCASGTVGAHADSESVALLGFNLNEDPATADCSYDPSAAQGMGPPGVQLTGDGIAANVVKRSAGTEGSTSYQFRVQVQGPNGATDPNDRWCANITGVPEGKIFVPFSSFSTECWKNTLDETNKAYDGEPISAVVFLVPGSPVAVPYDFCVNGFAPGNSAEDAPDGPADLGDQQGTVGYANVSPDGDFDRAKVVVDGKEYIIQNNNWGKPQDTDLILSYFNNSFKITNGYGSEGPVVGAPASFPSIYIGANGNTANGVYSTSTTDTLPRQISDITSINSKFAWSGSTNTFNATYDIWFANSPPTQAYDDGIDGFVMVWVHNPSGEVPIGTVRASDVSIADRSWTVWAGERGAGPAGNNNAQVVSFVANSTISSGDFDLLEFIQAAETYGIGSDMYLTDVFFGFEIWNGGAGGDLGVDEFTCVVE